MDDFAKQHQAGLDAMGANVGLPDPLAALGGAIWEAMGDDVPDKLVAALGLVVLWHKSASKELNGQYLSMQALASDRGKTLSKLGDKLAQAEHDTQTWERTATVAQHDLARAHGLIKDFVESLGGMQLHTMPGLALRAFRESRDYLKGHDTEKETGA